VPLYPLGISRRREIQDVTMLGRSSTCRPSASESPPQTAGAVGVCWSMAGELACAFIDAPRQAVPPMLHATVLDAIHRRICVLPVRFGVALHAEADIHAMLEDRHDQLLDQLGRLDRASEMGVQIKPATAIDGGRKPALGAEAAALRWSISNAHAAASRRGQTPLAYLDGRRSHYRREDEDTERCGLLSQQFVDALHDCCRQWRRLPATPSHPIRLAFLVERGRAAGFQNRVVEFGRTRPECRCVVLGPWPPYSFVEPLAECLHANAGRLGNVEPMQSAQE
jgi:hypothetical protein